MSEKMVRFDVENETGDSHMVTMVTEDMYAVMNLMNDYNLTWECVYTILLQEVSDGKNGFSYVPNVLLKKLLHEFNVLHGLYASDNKEMLQPFRLDYTDLIKLVESVIEDE